jgi:hypothetical protein
MKNVRVGEIAVPAQRAEQIVALEVQRHQANRVGNCTDRALHGGFLALDVDRQVHLEDRHAGSASETQTPCVHARTEDDDGVDIPQGLLELVVDEALAAGDE